MGSLKDLFHSMIRSTTLKILGHWRAIKDYFSKSNSKMINSLKTVFYRINIT